MSKIIDTNALNKNNNKIKNLINNEIIERSSMIYKNNNHTYITSSYGPSSLSINNVTAISGYGIDLNATDSYLNITANEEIVISNISDNNCKIHINAEGDLDIDVGGDIFIDAPGTNSDGTVYANVHDVQLSTDDNITINANGSFYLSAFGNEMYLSNDVVIRGHDSDGEGDGDVYIESQNNNVYIDAASGLYMNSVDLYMRVNGELEMTTNNNIYFQAKGEYYIKPKSMSTSVTLKQYIQGVMNGTY